MSKLEELDERDLKLIMEYVRDSRQSLRQISKRVHAAPSTLLERTKRLERKGVIKGYSAIIDYEKLGYESTVVTHVTVSGGKLEEVERSIAKFPEVIAVYDVSGPSDAIVIARFKTKKEVSDFTKKLLSMRYVERATTYIVLNVMKETLGFMN